MLDVRLARAVPQSQLGATREPRDVPCLVAGSAKARQSAGGLERVTHETLDVPARVAAGRSRLGGELRIANRQDPRFARRTRASPQLRGDACRRKDSNRKALDHTLAAR